MTRIFLITVITLLLCAVWAQSVVLASEEELYKEMEVLRAQIAELKAQVAEQKCSIMAQQGTVNEVKRSLIQAVPAENFIKYEPGEGVELPCGFKMQADATFIIQGTPHANNAVDINKSRCDASWSSDIFIEKAFDDWGLALLHLEPGQSNGLEGALSLYSNVNRDINNTDSNVPITELWYQHSLFNKQLVVAAGKMDPANYLDQNEYAFNECTQFLARIFRNSPAIEWPDDNTLGAFLAVVPEMIPYVALNATYFNANNTYKDIFDKPFVSAEINFQPAKAFKYDEKNWGGNYRVYWWYNGLSHPKYVAQLEQPGDDAENKNTGLGLSFDQKITEAFGVFARFGWQRPDIGIVSANPNAAPIEAMWSVGAQMTGKYWNREDDVLGFAVGQALPSKAYKDSDAALVAGASGAAEGHIELYYNMKLTKNLAITPDFQWIWNPHGISEPYQGQGFDRTIFIYGMRGQLDF